MADMTTAKASVRENSLEEAPVTPAMKKSGMKAAISDRLIDDHREADLPRAGERRLDAA